MPQSAAERRRQKSRELKAQRIKAAKRRKVLKTGAVAALCVALVGALGFAGYKVWDQEYRAIPGLDEYPDQSNDHVAEPPVYEQSPPVGGPHFEYWQNCGVYTEPVADFLAVHSLEHGTVWITYDPDLPDEDVEALESLHTPGSYVLVSPYLGDMPGPIVASAWEYQLVVDSPADEDLTRFLRRYEQSDHVPEPGAACSGAVGETAAELEAQGFTTGTPGIEPAEDAAEDESTEEDETDEDGDDPADEDDADADDES
ncbi:DUF3105 domain-containing protein [Spiractinospora alimapuensis]|uniref:DUF3105 domain-containing protein n=1 Tax=Spiractinospora alimapuensis TaxID=2820884 RepID=UPI001F40EE71|nr:DUF3105 domain-containing protein [Spiractinospora alimapuensis]QVQ51654.1 DUF3105 domain-containing protein [Spiractinospora alimapuensis]